MYTEMIPHLFRTEYQKIVAVLCRAFGIEHIAVAEDIVSDTFLTASEVWSAKGLPPNPVAWLYTVAKNKAKDYLKRHSHFAQHIYKELQHSGEQGEEMELDLSVQNIRDSQLAMIFVVCHPCNTAEAQIALALNILCGFSADEIASAFLTNRDVIYKRLQRAKEKLRQARLTVAPPALPQINERLGSVLTTLYLLFNEGYYSSNSDAAVRKDLCAEAMRLTSLLLESTHTATPAVNALLALMCFQSSRFDARTDDTGAVILYQHQDTSRWNKELIAQGSYFLQQSSQGNALSKYHLEAGIAYWHTLQEDTTEKWESILQLYNQLLCIEYSPMAALNRTYALAKAAGKEEAIREAEKMNLAGNYLYHALLGELYTGADNGKALEHLGIALHLAKKEGDKTVIRNKMEDCEQGKAVENSCEHPAAAKS